jgi:carboxyl-terminal processing protease
LWEDGKLVILTDEYSASASEILSGSIQDWDRGLIVGRRTYGKGLVQRPIDLTDGSQMRLTIARYYTPSGRCVQKPYDDIDDYPNDLNNRYKNGENTNMESINLSDS